MARRRLAGGLAAAAALALVAALAACSSSGSSAGTTDDTTASASSADAPSTTAAPDRRPDDRGTDLGPGRRRDPLLRLARRLLRRGLPARQGVTTDGFAYQLVDEAGAQQHPLELANFACSGATTTSLLNDVGCPSVALGPGAAPYDSQTQIEAAEAFLQAHPGQVDLITVSIGGNDVTKCAAQPGPGPAASPAPSARCRPT